MLPTQPAAFEDLTSSLPTAVAAWTVADVCRREVPAADPLPMHACAPVLRDGNSFLIHYGSHDGDGFRVVMNGRLTAPHGARAAGEGGNRPAGDDACRFIPCKPAGACGLPDESIHITVVPRGEGSRIRIDLSGRPATGSLVRHLRTALDAMASVAEAEQLQRAGESTAADVCAREALRQGSCCAHHGRFAARLLTVRAQAMLVRQDLDAAREFLRQAVLRDPGYRPAHRALHRTEQRLGVSPWEDRGQGVHPGAGAPRIVPAGNPGAMPAAPGVEPRPRDRQQPKGSRQASTDRRPAGAGARWNVAPESIAWVPTAQQIAATRRRAEDYLAAGDAWAARAWARKARAEAPRSATTARLLARIEAELDLDQGLVLRRQWMTLETHGFDADLVQATVRSHLSQNNPASALRVLLRFYPAWPTPTRHLADRWIERIVAQLPNCQALRILARSSPALAIRFAPRRAPGPAFAALTSRLEQLRQRSSADRETRALARARVDGFRHAPGVRPAAPIR